MEPTLSGDKPVDLPQKQSVRRAKELDARYPNAAP